MRRGRTAGRGRSGAIAARETTNAVDTSTGTSQSYRHRGEEIIRADLQTEIEARNTYIEAASYCFSVKDRVSEQLFESIIKSEEGHIDFLETQQALIKQLGVQLYSQKHMGGLSG